MKGRGPCPGGLFGKPAGGRRANRRRSLRHGCRRSRGGFVTTILVMVVLVTATVSLTWASRQVISARHEQFRRSREDSLQRMLAAGSEWLAAGGAASLPTEPGATLRLPLPDEDAASSIDKVVLWQREPAGTFRVTARWIRAASRPERAASAERTASTEPGVLAEKVRRGIRLPSAPRPRPAGTLKTNVLSAAEGEPE